MIKKGTESELYMIGMLRQKQQTIEALKRAREMYPKNSKGYPKIKTTINDFIKYKKAGSAWEKIYKRKRR